MTESLRPQLKESKPSAKKALGKVAVETEKHSFPHLLLRFEDYSGLDNSQILEEILGRVESLREGNSRFVLAGFAGRRVYKNKSFGDRWYTWGVPEEESKNNVGSALSIDHDPIRYAFEADDVLPAVAVFNEDKLVNIAADQKLDALYESETGDIATGDQYGVADGTLDDAAVAVFYFAPRQNT